MRGRTPWDGACGNVMTKRFLRISNMSPAFRMTSAGGLTSLPFTSTPFVPVTFKVAYCTGKREGEWACQ